MLVLAHVILVWSYRPVIVKSIGGTFYRSRFMAYKIKYSTIMSRNQPYRAHRQTRRWRLQESALRQELQSDSVALSHDGSAEDDGNVIAQSAEGSS